MKERKSEQFQLALPLACIAYHINYSVCVDTAKGHKSDNDYVRDYYARVQATLSELHKSIFTHGYTDV